MTRDYPHTTRGATLHFPQSPGGLRSSLFASPSGGWGSFYFEHLCGSVASNDERSTEAMQ